MELFIRIVDGQPFEHPIFGDNFRAAFPEVDINNLPAGFARFERVAPPVLGVYEVYEGVSYEMRADGVYTDMHQVRQMTAEEIASKQHAVKAAWNNRFPSWVFDEATCSFMPPVPYPTDNKTYRWDEPTISWVEVSNA